jgi:hypothetical protein
MRAGTVCLARGVDEASEAVVWGVDEASEAVVSVWGVDEASEAVVSVSVSVSGVSMRSQKQW